MATLGARLRTVFAGLFGGQGYAAGVVPWHLHRHERPPMQLNAQTALTLTAVYKACSLLADAATSAPAMLYARPVGGGRVLDQSSAAARALATVAHADMELFAHSTALMGNGYLRIYRDGNGAPQELRALAPYLVTVGIEQGTLNVFYRVMADPITGEAEVLLPEADVIHAKYRVTSNRFYGVPPMASCAPAFEQALQSRAVQKYLFQNLASPGMVLLAPGKIDESVARKLQTEWDNNFSGTGTGKTVVLSNGLDAKPVLWKAGDQQLLEQIQASVQDIARAFSIPQFYLEHLQTATFASASEQTRALWWSAQKPFTMRLADAMALKLIGRNDRAAGAGIEFDLNASLVMPGKEMSDFLGGLVNAGICTPSELRNSYLNLPDQPGGDVLRVPANSTSADTSLAGAKAWDRARTYEPGTLCLHAAGVWRAAVETTNDEPRQDSADWDCLVGGVTAAAFEDGELTLRLSGGHSIKALQ